MGETDWIDVRARQQRLRCRWLDDWIGKQGIGAVNRGPPILGCKEPLGAVLCLRAIVALIGPGERDICPDEVVQTKKKAGSTLTVEPA